MSFRRIMLKDVRGEAKGAVTLMGTPSRVTLPEGVTALLCLTDGSFIPLKEASFLLPSEAGNFSLIAEREGALLFASTLAPKEASFAKWRLLSALNEQGTSREKDPLEMPVEETLPQEAETAPSDREAQSEIAEDEASPTQEAPDETTAKDTPLERARALLDKGAPFPLFESLMPNSRWALIRDDDAEYLVGIKREEDGEHVLFGIPGTRDLPPDEDRLWTFFPTDEEAGMGYYLTESDEA